MLTDPLVEELVVPDDGNRCIKEVLLRSGNYIDQIGFKTDENISLGPVGGNGGDIPDRKISPKKNSALCLHKIEGTTTDTAISSLKFTFTVAGR